MSLICAQNVIDHRSNVKLFIQAERKDSAFLCNFAVLVWLEVLKVSIVAVIVVVELFMQAVRQVQLFCNFRILALWRGFAFLFHFHLPS